MKSSKLLFLLITAFIILTALISCSGKDSENESGNTNSEYHVSFTDDMGVTFELNEKPENVAVLFSSYAQIFSLCGGEIKVTVGDSVTRGFVDEGTVLVNDTAGLKIDMETLVASNPDLVICTADLSAQAEACEELNRMGIKAAAFREESFEDYLRILQIFADICENDTVYEEYGLKVKAEIDSILSSDEISDIAPMKYMFIRAGSSFSSTKAKTAEDHFACVMIDEIGMKSGIHNIAADAQVLSEELSLEAVITADPDVIFIVPQGNVDNAKAYIDELFSSEGWSLVDAVKENRYVFLDKELFNYKPNQRWAEAYEIILDYLIEYSK